MKQYCFLYLLFFFLLSCAQSQPQQLFNSEDTIAVAVPGSTILSGKTPQAGDGDFDILYTALKDSIQQKRKSLYNDYMQADAMNRRRILDSAGSYVQQSLVHNIFPFWYGTVWDFNGISDKPQQGTIACGYFLSNTLKHTGFILNRYKLAQQYSHSIVNTLCSDIHTFRQMDLMLKYISTLPDNLYVVGLDNHVGFIHKEKSSVTFIHSSFVQPGCVVSEQATQSLVLPSSSVYVIGNLSGNKALLLKWLKTEPIPILP